MLTKNPKNPQIDGLNYFNGVIIFNIRFETIKVCCYIDEISHIFKCKNKS